MTQRLCPLCPPESSKGRTSHFGCDYRGSNPLSGAPRLRLILRRSASVRSVPNLRTMESRVSQAPRRTVVVLAAGEGKRMKSATPKVLHPLLGRTLLGHVLAAAGASTAERTLGVVGHRADQVEAHLAQIAPAATPVLQAEQRGTGHAVRI